MDLTTVENNLVKIDRMTTKLTYNGSFYASSLQQAYCYPINGLPFQDWDEPVNNPITNVAYRYDISNAQWYNAYGHPYPGFSTLVYIYCEGDCFEIIVKINNTNELDYTGTW